MRDDSEASKKVPPRPGKIAAAALRAIDACERALQRLRARFDAGEEGEDGRERKTPGEAEAPPPPRRIGVFTGLLILVACLLAGAAAGSWSAYRAMAKVLAVRAAAVERLQDDLDATRKEQTRSVNQTARFQKENGELRLQLLDAQGETKAALARIEALEKQSAQAGRVARPAPAGRVAAPSPAPTKTGTCAVGTGNPGADLTNCIEDFNRK